MISFADISLRYSKPYLLESSPEERFQNQDIYR